MKKILIFCFATTSAVIIFYQPIFSWVTSAPTTTFDHTNQPPEPNYKNPKHWAALPTKNDNADIVPPKSGFKNKQDIASADVFFVHPTTAFIGDEWNANVEDMTTNIITDMGVINQHVTPFNGSAKIYAPRYRQIRFSVWSQSDMQSRNKALDLAYSDIKKAFEYYLEHWNQGRPIIIASHSQGTHMTERLMADYFDGKPLSAQLIAAYLIGKPIISNVYSHALPQCSYPSQTGCYVSWNTIAIGGNTQFLFKHAIPYALSCVNPLSWLTDKKWVDRTYNQGSLPMVGLFGLGELNKKLVGAGCDEAGVLWIDEPSHAGYSASIFEGKSYHTYDYNLFYSSIRHNLKTRIAAFQKNNQQL